MIKSIGELEETEELCEYCSCTDYGTEKINTNMWNQCEGCNCKEAYKDYLEERKG